VTPSIIRYSDKTENTPLLKLDYWIIYSYIISTRFLLADATKSVMGKWMNIKRKIWGKREAMP
jgi:hypothetical protein